MAKNMNNTNKNKATSNTNNVQEKGKTGDQAKYQLKTYASEEAYAADKNNSKSEYSY